MLVQMAAGGAAHVLQGKRMVFRGLSPASRLSVSFAFVILAGAFLLMLPFATVDGKGVPAIDALFISTSAVCVTGLSTIDVGATLTFAGQATLLMLIQVGGLGFMTLASGLVLGMGGKVSLLSRQAVVGSLSAVGERSLEQLLRTGLITTLLCELAGAFVLALRFKGLPGYDWGDAIWAGVFHSVSAFCNAGFSIFSKVPSREGFENLTFFVSDGAVNITIIALIVLGGLGFLVIDDVILWWQKEGRRPLSLHSKIVLTTTVVLIVLGAVLFFALEFNRPQQAWRSWDSMAWGSLFQSITARTAGFNTMDLGQCGSSTLLILMLLMTVGGSPASCAGGVKTTTAFIVCCVGWNRLMGRRDAVAFGRNIGLENVSRAATLLQITLFVLAGMLILVLVAEGENAKAVSRGGAFLDHIFEVISAYSTTGLSTGITSTLTPYSKLVLVVAMFMGRVGPLSIFVWLAEAPRRDKIQYPDEPLLVG